MSALAKQLGFLDRRDLALVLDQRSPRGNDWRGLADKMGFAYTLIMVLEKKESPTLTLLEEWERTFGAEATLDKLIGLLEALDIQEAVEVLKKAKVKNVHRVDPVMRNRGSSSTSSSQEAFLGVSERDRTDSTLSTDSLHHPLTPCNSIDPTQVDPEMLRRIQQARAVDPQQVMEKIKEMDIRDKQESAHDQHVTLREELRRVQYDVFLSFNSADEEFAEEVRQRLQTKANLRVFIPSENMLPGRVYSEEIADIITEGCRKVVIILSPDYVQSEWCNYAVKLTVHQSPDYKKHILIPIVYRPCKIPAYIQLLWHADYPKYQDKTPQEIEKVFWHSVYSACRSTVTR